MNSLDEMCKHAIDDVKSSENDRGRTFRSIFVNKVKYPYPNSDFHENIVHNVCNYMLDRLKADRYDIIRDDERFIKIVKTLQENSK